jgi:tetratricopeptide (TPR) repeat protein
MVVVGLLAGTFLGWSVHAQDGVPPPTQPILEDSIENLPREERIDALFDRLRSPEKSAAKSAERAILGLWMESGSDTVDLLMRWALKATQEKDYALALDFLDRVVVMRPEFVEGWNKRATVIFLTEEYGKSIADIGRVLEIEPRHFGAIGGLGMIMKALGEDERALSAFSEALSLDPLLDNIREAVEELEQKVSGTST